MGFDSKTGMKSYPFLRIPRSYTFILFISILFFQSDAYSQTTKKWFPGHYVDAGVDEYSTTSKGMRILGGTDGWIFKGLFIYVTWQQIETTKDVYQWSRIDNLLSALPAGKKLALAVQWQAWSSGVQACPDDMLGNPLYDGGQRSRDGKWFSTIHMTATMDRYLAFLRAIADRYDNDERLAFVTSGEIPYENSLKVGLYNEATARANMFRLAEEMPVIFKKTVSGILGAWWSFGGGDTEKNRFAQTVFNAGGAFGFPDLMCSTCSHYDSHFRATVIANSGKWPCWMGIEWADYLPERTGSPFPEAQLQTANSTKTNFIWWLTANRTSEGGYNLDYDAINYLRAHPDAGITKDYPGTSGLEEISSDGIIAYPSPTDGIIKINLTDAATLQEIALINFYGRTVGMWKNTDEINIKGQPEGIYLLRIKTSSGAMVMQKIIKN
jgi:hypothetical protein